jgi:Holliday junction resolvasome RuvABC ATP-dependent DNA helicase subunit
MSLPSLEEVYKTSGVPTYTFVKPAEYHRMIVGLRTPGRGLIVEGPSGIGKTTGILKALEELGLAPKTLDLSARKIADREMIAELPAMGSVGTVLIDDFHRLENSVKQVVADYMKTLADEEKPDSKLILIGINKAGDSLVRLAADLNNRVDTISLETNSEEHILELIGKGEDALNIALNTRKR